MDMDADMDMGSGRRKPRLTRQAVCSVQHRCVALQHVTLHSRITKRQSRLCVLAQCPLSNLIEERPLTGVGYLPCTRWVLVVVVELPVRHNNSLGGLHVEARVRSEWSAMTSASYPPRVLQQVENNFPGLVALGQLVCSDNDRPR